MQLRYAETRFRMKPYSAGLNALKPSRMGCIPQDHGEFVACTEGVFDLYAETPIRSARWSALTKARSQLLAELAPTDRGQRRSARALRLRVQAQRHRQSVHLLRRAHWPLAQGRRHRQPRRGRLRRLYARPSPTVTSRRQSASGRC